MKTVVSLAIALPFLFYGCAVHRSRGTDSVNKKDVETAGLRSCVREIKSCSYKAVLNADGTISKGMRAGKSSGYDCNSYWVKYNREGYMLADEEYDRFGHMIQSFTCKYNKREEKTGFKRFDSLGRLIVRYSYVYDSKGNRLRGSCYNSGGGIIWESLFKYDHKGNKIEAIAYDSYGNIVWKKMNRYDSYGKITESTNTNNGREFRLFFKYDKSGRSSGFIKKDGKDSLDMVCTVEYDENGDKTVIRRYYPGTAAAWTNKNISDAHGRILNNERFDSNGKRFMRCFFRYDERGNEIEFRMYEVNDKLKTVRNSSYVYDEKGNWIKRTVFLKAVPAYIEEREIQYFH